MKDFTPTATAAKELRAEKNIGIQEAVGILTGKNVLVELQDISTSIEDGVHVDHTAQQLKRLTDVLIFMVQKGAIKF